MDTAFQEPKKHNNLHHSKSMRFGTQSRLPKSDCPAKPSDEVWTSEKWQRTQQNLTEPDKQSTNQASGRTEPVALYPARIEWKNT